MGQEMTPAQREEYHTKQHEKMLKERTKGMTTEQRSVPETRCPDPEGTG